jgi:hypothetical protein
MKVAEEKLDNPVYYSLNEVHNTFAINSNGVKFYYPDYCPFGGFIDPYQTAKSIKAYSALTNNIKVVGAKPIYSNELKLIKVLACNQMLLKQRKN